LILGLVLVTALLQQWSRGVSFQPQIANLEHQSQLAMNQGVELCSALVHPHIDLTNVIQAALAMGSRF